MTYVLALIALISILEPVSAAASAEATSDVDKKLREIKPQMEREEELAVACHAAPRAESPEARRACADLAKDSPQIDQALSAINIRGDGDLFLASRAQYLSAELERCGQIAFVGDGLIASQCIRRALNALDFATRVALESRTPREIWAACAKIMADDLPNGARCVGVASSFCKNDQDAWLTNLAPCLTVISNGMWVHSPLVRKLHFNWKR
jgi:hypothetical protein